MNDPFQEETLDLQKVILKYLHLWHWFVLCVILALGVAGFINAFKQNIYENRLTLLIHQDDPLLRLDGLSPSAAFSTIHASRIQNEIGILTSRTLTYNTLKSLDFGIEYYEKKSFFINKNLFPNPYFVIELDSLYPQVVNVPLQFSRKNDTGQWVISGGWEEANRYKFDTEKLLGTIAAENFQLTVSAGHWVESPYFRFRILENYAHIPAPDQQFIVILRDIYTLVNMYRNIQVEEVRNSTMLMIKTQGTSRKRNADYLNMLAGKFLQRELDKKNIRAQKTIDFINQQLAFVSQSLHLSESDLEHFRSSEQILNIDFQSQRSFEQMERLQQEKARKIINEKYYQYLSNYLDQSDEDGRDLLAPASLGVEDPLLTGLISQLMNLYNERSELLINSRRDNPYLNNVQSRIQHTKNTIKESLKNIKHANSIAQSDLDKRLNEISQKISLIPESQRHLFTIERQFKLDDALFTFLQSKKSEMEITKSGYTPVHEIIDPALASDGRLISPKKRMSYYLAILTGLLIPVMFIVIRNFFNDKVNCIEDVERNSPYPILGDIARNPLKTPGLISFENPSLVAESFRSLRTNSQFVVPMDKTPVIMVTSTLPEEGKTFVSLNLAASYAGTGKKTVLISLDLRKPKLYKYLGKEMPVGLSNYLCLDIQTHSIINKSGIENLDVIFSGQIPPNPAELLTSPKLATLFSWLIQQYEYVVIDTPPVGMVSDALLLLEYVNVVVFLVRHNKTPIKHLQYTLKGLKEKAVKNLNIVMNDVPVHTRFGYYNTYGYQYGYFEKKKVLLGI